MRLGSILVLFAFVNVQVLALVVGWLFLFKQVPPIVDNPADVGNSVYLFAQILVAAVAMLLVLKYYKGNMLFRFFEYALIFITFWTFAGLLAEDDLVGIAVATAAVLLRWRYQAARNPFMLFSSAIIGSLLGVSLDILPAAVFAILLSAYDFAAVFLTKHMIALAEGLRGRGAAFSISFPSAPFDKKAQATTATAKGMKLAKGEKLVKVRAETVELGTGDLVIPAILVVSALKVSVGAAVAAMVGATIGIAVLFYYIDKRKGYWPALPPIVGGSLLALGLYTLIAGMVFGAA
ncbi:MAG: presenilin family intramembrane aspartyl protease [Candidatus Micrarchaeota archaeon]